MSVRQKYAHDVNQIRNALHNRNGSRACVMVGAGFSFNADKKYSSAPDFPSWTTLTRSMIARLYPSSDGSPSPNLSNAEATSTALRIAQEFEAAFGRTVLLNHIRDHIPDTKYEPSALHSSLLKLPWTDVFTTNYDTLLEKAALPLRERRYEVVRCINDLPLKRGPRIVKLHGTLPELSDCVITEEDFRQYPQIYSPFVAEVQVAMVESHLCLAGFSGDDPNFLAWSGWVRDRLGKQTLPTYLFVFEEPTPFQNRMLEQRHVFPIPLFAVTGATDRREALKRFIDLLGPIKHDPKPQWCVSSNPVSDTFSDEPTPPSDVNSLTIIQFVEAALQWKASREVYPGWLVPHPDAVRSLWRDTKGWMAACQKLTSSPENVHRLVFAHSELLWRVRRCCFPVYDHLTQNSWPALIDQYFEWRQSHIDVGHPVEIRDGMSLTVRELDKKAVELQLECLRHARETGDRDRFERTDNILGTRINILDSSSRQQASHFRIHQRALQLMADWKDESVDQLLAEWDTDADPLWSSRRAALLTERGKADTAEKALSEALIRVRAIDYEGTPETLSIEAWIIFNLRAIDTARQRNVLRPPANAGKEAEASSRVDENLNSVKEKSTEEKTAGGDQSDNDAAFLEVRREELLGTMRWLKERDCDPRAIMRWLNDESSKDSKSRKRRTRTKGFGIRQWTSHIGLGSSLNEDKLDAAYRSLRVIEEAGIPLNIHGSRSGAGQLVQSAIKFLTPMGVAEVPPIVMRCKSRDLIESWYTRTRVAMMTGEKVNDAWNASNAAIRNSLDHLATLEPDNPEFREVSAAIELFSRVSVRQSQEVLQEALSLAITLPIKARIGERRWLASQIATLIVRIGDSMSTDTLSKHLVELLNSPVPGTSGFPRVGNSRWIDPVDLLDGRRLNPDEAHRSSIGAVVDKLISRVEEIGVSSDSAKERVYLVRRLATLADVDLLSADQLTGFGRALFAVTDATTGFPKETGCLDSLILLTVNPRNVDEHALFRQKYILSEWPTKGGDLVNALRTLSRSGPGGAGSKLRPGRGVAWTGDELNVIASRCRAIVEQLVDQESDDDPDVGLSKSALRHFFMDARPTEILKCVEMVLDDLVLQREVVADSAWKEVELAVQIASDADMPILHIYPKLTSFDRRYKSRLVSGIVSRLSSRDEDRVRIGLSVLNHWANQSSDERFPSIGLDVLHSVVGMLQGGYVSYLISVIDTIRNLTSRLPLSKARALLRLANYGLRAWSLRLVYNQTDESDVDAELIEELPELREAFARLCTVARTRGIELDGVSAWVEQARTDEMPEMKKALSGLED